MKTETGKKNHKKEKMRRYGGCFVCMACLFYLLTGCEGVSEPVWDLTEESPVEQRNFDVEEAGNQETAEDEDAAAPEISEEVSRKIYVHVCGAVERPGVYELPFGSRFFEAVDAAGGFSAEACQDYLNMASLLEDGSMLKIPTLKEAEEREKTGQLPEGTENGAGSEDGLININTADVTELSTLPGIGEARAKAILEYREKQGGFQKKEDLMQVSGIGKKMYAKIKDYISV